MTQFFHRVGPRTNAVRQVWLLAALAVAATALVLWLMDHSSRQVRHTSERLSDTQESMHKMAVSLDMRLSDAQTEQSGWLSARPPSQDDAALKLEESLAERFSQIRSATHLASISTNLLDLENSVRDLKRLSESCREWYLSRTNTAAKIASARAEVIGSLRHLSQELERFESLVQAEQRTNLQGFLALPPGSEANRYARKTIAHMQAQGIRTEAGEALLQLKLLVERMLGEESTDGLIPYHDSLLAAAYDRLFAALEKVRGSEHALESIGAAIDTARPRLRALVLGTNSATSEDGLHALCVRRLELNAIRSELFQQSSDRIGEIRFNSVDLQIGFNTLQREAAVAASMAMQHASERLLWFGVGIGFVFLLLAFRIAGTLREQLNTIQRNSAELDKAATEAKAAADSLGRNEQRTRLILDTAMDAVISMDERGLITGWNKQAEQALGWSAGEVTGQLLANFLIPERLRKGHTEGLTRFLRTGTGKVLNQRLEVPALRKDGTEIPVELSITPICYAGQVSFSAFLRDISDRKNAEQEVLRSKERLEALNKKLQASLATAEQLTVEAQSASKAKSEFLATMSHEIRTPMNGILGFTGLLLDTSLEDEQREYLTTIKGSADALLAIINDILDFSKVEAGKMQLESNWFELAPVVQEVSRLLSAQATAKKLELHLAVGANLPRVLADSARVRQVLLNLAGNAIKFTPSGRVTIGLAPEPPDAGAVLRDGTKGFIRVSVTDTGIGIPKEKQAQMFQKFVQADSSHSRRYGGTGLGLAICKSLVELMGGRIGFDSEDGKGSTFWFTLACDEVSVEAAPAPSMEAGPSRATKPGNAVPTLEVPPGFRVLLVEDNRTNQLLATTLLRKMGCEIDIAVNGLEGVQMATERFYALVLMDCHMPEMNGFEATAEIRRWETSSRVTRRLPIIALTASLMEEDKRECEKAGMDDFLGKPIQLGELVLAVRRWGLPQQDGVKAP